MNIVVSGTRHEGKSTLSLFLARQFSDTVVIIDPRGTFDDVGIQCEDADDLLDHLESADYLPSKENKLPRPMPLVLTIDGDVKEYFSPVIKRLLPWRFRFSGKIALIVDEARELQSPHSIDSQLNRIIRQAPPHKVCVIQNTHQMMDWNSATKSVTDDFYLFRQFGPRNYKVIEEHFGPEVADITAALPHHHLVHAWFDRRGGADQTFEVWDDPSKWYEPIAVESNEAVHLAQSDSEEPEEIAHA